MFHFFFFFVSLSIEFGLPLDIIDFFYFRAYAIPASFSSGLSSAPIYLDDVKCVGPETNILQCNMTNIGDNDCDHDEDIGVFCTGIMFYLIHTCSTDKKQICPFEKKLLPEVNINTVNDNVHVHVGILIAESEILIDTCLIN